MTENGFIECFVRTILIMQFNDLHTNRNVFFFMVVTENYFFRHLQRFIKSVSRCTAKK